MQGKKKINVYWVIYEKDGKIENQCFNNIDSAINNLRVLVLMGYTAQIFKYRTEVGFECSNVWKQ